MNGAVALTLAAQVEHAAEAAHEATHSAHWLACVPFVLILLSIAILPLIRRTHHWWEENRNKLLVAAVLAGVTLGYYQFRDVGVHHSDAGFDAVLTVLDHAVLIEYVPFIVLLFSLYVISGGIVIRGDIQATPLNNTIILAIGGTLGVPGTILMQSLE